MARKVLLLQETQSEVLVLTSRKLFEAWPAELRAALLECAHRGLLVKILLEDPGFTPSPLLGEFHRAGVETRGSSAKFSWFFRARPVQGELWILDRERLLAVNERTSANPHPGAPALAVECLMGAEAAHGTAAYFEQRWNTAALPPLAFSVRHKSYSFHSGHQAESEFFSCLLGAQNEVSLSVPGGHLSRGVAGALAEALQHGLRVTIFTNAEGDNAPALRRLRRLASLGAVVKICGRRLRSECAVVDASSVYMGSLPASWLPLRAKSCPVFVMHDKGMGQEILAALESQVSVEINGDRASSFYAYR